MDPRSVYFISLEGRIRTSDSNMCNTCSKNLLYAYRLSGIFAHHESKSSLEKKRASLMPCRKKLPDRANSCCVLSKCILCVNGVDGASQGARCKPRSQAVHILTPVKLLAGFVNREETIGQRLSKLAPIHTVFSLPHQRTKMWQQDRGNSETPDSTERLFIPGVYGGEQRCLYVIQF